MSSHDAGLYSLFQQACSLEGDERSRLIAKVEIRDAELAIELRDLLSADQNNGALPRGATLDAPPHVTPMAGTQTDEVRLRAELTELVSLGRGIGAYEAGAELGSGAMGRVRRVLDRSLRRELAMKTLRDDGLGEPDPVRLARFLNEARILGRLDHPGIVSIHELGVDADGHPYFTMPVVAGGDLRSIFEKVRRGEGDWSLARAIGVLQRVCEAMAFAHASGVVHRDLKPANIMVGRFGEVQVMDWGLARTLGEPDHRDLRPTRQNGVSAAAESPVRTMDGAIVGTPCFMSPEQARGSVADIDGRSDVYAVGATLYELLAGRRPYEEPGGNNAPYSVLSRLIARKPMPVSMGTDSLPSELVAICEKAMHRDRELRYSTMEELGVELRAYLEGRVVRAHRTGPMAEFVKWVQRNRVAAATGAVLLTLAIAGTAIVAMLERANARREHSLRTKAEDERAAADRSLEFLEGLFYLASPDMRATVPTLRDVLDTGSSSIEAALGDDPEPFARLRYAMGQAYRRIGVFDEAERLLAAVHEYWSQTLPGNDFNRLGVTLQLGTLRMEAGDPAGALPLLHRARDGYLATLGEDHRQTMMATGALAKACSDLRRYTEEGEILLPLVQRAERVLGPMDTQTLGFRALLGSHLVRTGRPAEALPVVEQALAGLSETTGDASPSTLMVLNTHVRALRALGRFEESEAVSQRAIDLARKELGEGAPIHLDLLESRAYTLAFQRRFDEAEAVIVGCAELSRDTYGEYARYTLQAELTWAVLSRLAGRAEETRGIVDEVYARASESLGPSDYLTRNCLREMAEYAESQGDREAAAVLYRRVIEATPVHDPDLENLRARLSKLEGS